MKPPQMKMVEVQWPLAGLNRRMGYQAQPPYSTVDSLNVQNDHYPSYRERGGSRPGLIPAFRNELGSGNPVQMMAKLDLIEASGFTFWADDFSGLELGGIWTEGTFTGVDGSPEVEEGLAYSELADGLVAVTRADFSPVIAPAAIYEINLYAVPDSGLHSADYYIYARMGAGLDPFANGVVARLNLTAGVFSGNLRTYKAGLLVSTYAFTGGNMGYAGSGYFTLAFNGETASCYWRNNLLLTQSLAADALTAGTRLGFGMEALAEGIRARAALVRVQYHKTGQNQRVNRSLLCASSNGILYEEGVMGEMRQVSSSLTLASDRRIMAHQRTQRLFIADWGDPKVEVSNAVRGTGNDKLDSASVADWTTQGLSANDDVVVVFNATGDLVDGVYQISSIASGEITLTTAWATGLTGTAAAYVARSPKVYNPATGTLTKWVADVGKGSVPVGQPIICLWQDSVVMAGGFDSPHNWYKSRSGDPYDWDYSLADLGRAVAGTASNAGLIGEPITALMPHEDVCLWFGCYSSLWLMRGNPAAGGQIDKISDSIGVVDRFAWCLTPDFQIVFLSHDGIYIIQSGCSTEGITSLSRERIPAELLNVDANLIEVSMAYDLPRRGIHIYLTQKDSRKTSHFWLDWETKSFWPMTLPTDFEAVTCMYYTSFNADDNAIIVGGRDGYIRRYSYFDGRDDEGNQINSYLWVGPFNLGGIEYAEGILADIQGILAADSGVVDYKIYASSHPEEAYRKHRTGSANYEGEWLEAGLNPTHNPRVRGGSAFLRLSNGEDIPWSIEALRMRVVRAGEVRY